MATNTTDPKNVYICGPWYGENTTERFEEYLRLGGILVDRGFTPFFPAFFGTDPHPHFEEYMKETLYKLLLCRYIYLMRGWQHSYDAAFMYAIARLTGLKFLCDEGEFPEELDPCFPPERRDVRTEMCKPGEELTMHLQFTAHHVEDNEGFADYYKQRVLPLFTGDSETAAAEQRPEQTK